jgi:hypothetical protein
MQVPKYSSLLLQVTAPNNAKLHAFLFQLMKRASPSVQDDYLSDLSLPFVCCKKETFAETYLNLLVLYFSGSASVKKAKLCCYLCGGFCPPCTPD